MRPRRARSLGRAAAFAPALAAPGIAVLAALALSGRLAVASAFTAAAAVLLLCVLPALYFVLAQNALAAAIVQLAEIGEEAALRPGHRLPRPARESWLAALRLARAWRDRTRLTEARLAEAEGVIAGLPDPLLLIDERRRIVRANPAAAALLGAQHEPRDLAAALRNPALLAAADAVLAGEPARIVEFAAAAPAERQLRARIARIDGPSPEAAAAVLLLHDVSELKRSEQMRADFIANASHELRTPLASLTGFIETLRGPAREDAEAGERFLAIMQAEAARMTRLVEDLLSLSRIELHEHSPPTGEIALEALLRHAAETLELRAGERRMRLRFDLASDLPPVRGDPDELAQVFQNLLDNAIKYGRAGSEIIVEAGTAQRRRAPFVRVAVRDRGEGIAREHLPRLTERFYRVDTARSRELGGTGLGLAIVKHILNRHRGFLEIESEPGAGSVFAVLIPSAALLAAGDLQ